MKTEQNLFLVGQIADHSAEGRWQLLDQRRRGEDLVGFGLLGMLDDVDDLELVAALELARAEPAQVRDGLFSSQGLTGDIKLEQILGQRGLRARRCPESGGANYITSGAASRIARPGRASG